MVHSSTKGKIKDSGKSRSKQEYKRSYVGCEAVQAPESEAGVILAKEVECEMGARRRFMNVTLSSHKLKKLFQGAQKIKTLNRLK